MTDDMYSELHEVVEKYKAAGAAAGDDNSATVMVLMHGFPTEM